MAPQRWHIHFLSLIEDLGAQTRNGGEFSRKSRSEDCTNPNSNQGQICAPDTKIVITMFADCDYDICLAADKAHSSSRAMSMWADGILRDSQIMVSLWAVVGHSEIMVILIMDAAIQICRKYWFATGWQFLSPEYFHEKSWSSYNAQCVSSCRCCCIIGAKFDEDLKLESLHIL